MRAVPDVNDVSMAFGNIDHLPAYDEIPEPFKDWNNQTKWNDIIDTWFCKGLPPDTEFMPKEGVDAKKAFRAIAAIMRSWEPKHEHKTAGCAYLLSEWFDDVQLPQSKERAP